MPVKDDPRAARTVFPLDSNDDDNDDFFPKLAIFPKPSPFTPPPSAELFHTVTAANVPTHSAAAAASVARAIAPRPPRAALAPLSDDTARGLSSHADARASSSSRSLLRSPSLVPSRVHVAPPSSSARASPWCCASPSMRSRGRRPSNAIDSPPRCDAMTTRARRRGTRHHRSRAFARARSSSTRRSADERDE